MRRGTISILMFVLLAGFSGCGFTDSMNRHAKSMFSWRGDDYIDPTEEEDDAWITEAAQEARPNQARERDPDQWYKKYVMSEKARSIERNLGFD